MTKSFEIPKRLVWMAYQRVKVRAGRGTGVDGQSMEEFDRDLKNNLYRIWNRMSSGTYFPPPVKEVLIPKKDGGQRVLGVPTIGDRIAQMVVKMYLEPIVEPRFHEDSYAYRPRRSALDAVGKARERCWQYSWVLDLDIRKFFDSLDHDLVMRAVRRYTDCRWVLLYVERWLCAEVQHTDGTLGKRLKGTPQGGVISPLLANIFMHLAFDQWMQQTHPKVPFERYADDVLVHCRTKEHAEYMQQDIAARLRRCRLELHPEKTKVVYCKDDSRRVKYDQVSFEFLGYEFRPRCAKRKSGSCFTSFSPGVSRRAAKAMRQVIRREWRLQSKTNWKLEDLARTYNPIIRGWIAYYGQFYRSALYVVFRSLDKALILWAKRKYKRLRDRSRRACEWLRALAKRDRKLFAHWAMLPGKTLTTGQ